MYLNINGYEPYCSLRISGIEARHDSKPYATNSKAFITYTKVFLSASAFLCPVIIQINNVIKHYLL
jgi:hypothetical protein